MNTGARNQLRWFYLPGLAVFLVFVLIPASLTVLQSLTARAADGSMHLTTQHYRFFLTDAEGVASFKMNLIYLGLTLISEVGLGLGLALLLQKDSKLNLWVRLACFSPGVLSLVVIGLLFGFMFKDGIGMFPGWLQEGRAIFTISAVSGWAYCGSYMFIFLAGLSGISPSLLEAAQLDGCSRWAIIQRIQLPLLRPSIEAAVVICATGAFKAFDLFWVMLANQDHTSIVGTLIMREMFRFENREYACALATMLGLCVCLLSMLALWWKKRNDGQEVML